MPSTVRTRDPIKKAVSIGIEYREVAEQFPQWRLPAAHKDPMIMSRLLQEQYGYRPENITILTDAKNSNRLPTRDNIVASMHELVRDAQPGDRLVFHFSGHGSQVLAPPDHVEETDGQDEVIWPCDVHLYSDTEEVGNYILDDDVKKYLVDPLPAGVRLTILLDCCSSGTGADLPFSCGAPTLASPIHPREVNFCQPIPVPSPRVARQRSKSIVDLNFKIDSFDHSPKRRVTFQSLDEWPSKDIDPSTSPLVTSWAACLDNQGTLESSLGSVFLRALKESLKKSPQPTNGEMLSNITMWLHHNVPWRKLEQQPPKPQLSSNLSISFIYHSSFEL